MTCFILEDIIMQDYIYLKKLYIVLYARAFFSIIIFRFSFSIYIHSLT